MVSQLCLAVLYLVIWDGVSLQKLILLLQYDKAQVKISLGIK